MKIKKHFLTSIISLVAISNLFFNITFAAQPNLQTDKSIRAIIQKKNRSYEVVRLDIVIKSHPYQDSYKPFKERVSNGAIVSFKKENIAYFLVPDKLKLSPCEDSTNIAAGKINEECSDLPEREFYVDMPYFPNGKSADIYDQSGKRVLTIDLTSKATCNENDKCDQPIEDSENCPRDCKNKEPKIDPAIIQSSSDNQVAAQDAKKKISLADLGWWGIAILIILLAGGGIGYYIYRINKEE